MQPPFIGRSTDAFFRKHTTAQTLEGCQKNKRSLNWPLRTEIYFKVIERISATVYCC